MSKRQHRRFRALTARQVLRALLLSAAFLAAGAASAAAGPITCSFGDTYGGNEGACQNVSPEGEPLSSQTTRFQWAGYFLELTLYDPAGVGFDLTITDNPMSDTEFQSRVSSLPGSYVCIPMLDPSQNASACRDFFVSTDAPNPSEGGDFWSAYKLTIDWEWDSHNNGYAATDLTARILHNIGLSGYEDGYYDEDMCLEALGPEPGNYLICGYEPNPRIFSGDTDFQSFTPAIAVPEPALLFLFGVGASGAMYRRYRRS